MTGGVEKKLPIAAADAPRRCRHGQGDKSNILFANVHRASYAASRDVNPLEGRTSSEGMSLPISKPRLILVGNRSGTHEHMKARHILY